MDVVTILHFMAAVFFILAAAFIGFAVFLFFTRNIPDIHADLSGKKRAAAVAEFESDTQSKRRRRGVGARNRANTASREPAGAPPVKKGAIPHAEKDVGGGISHSSERSVAQQGDSKEPETVQWQDDSSKTRILPDDTSETRILEEVPEKTPDIRDEQDSNREATQTTHSDQNKDDGHDSEDMPFRVVRKIVLRESEDIIKVDEQGGVHE